MKILIEIPDKEVQFGMRVLRSSPFVKKASELPASSLALFKDLNEASKDVRLHKAGKLKLQTARELLNVVEYLRTKDTKMPTSTAELKLPPVFEAAP